MPILITMAAAIHLAPTIEPKRREQVGALYLVAAFVALVWETFR